MLSTIIGRLLHTYRRIDPCRRGCLRQQCYSYGEVGELARIKNVLIAFNIFFVSQIRKYRILFNMVENQRSILHTCLYIRRDTQTDFHLRFPQDQHSTAIKIQEPSRFKMRVTSSSSEDEGHLGRTPAARRRRGVATGVKRGKYRKYTQERKRIIEAAVAQQDWKAVAKANGVATQTAYSWIRNCEKEPSTRGGARRTKVNEEQIEKMIGYVEVDPTITLKAIRDKLEAEDGVSITTTTVHKYLDGRLYTVKKILREPSSMNSTVNKEKRAEYCSSLLSYIGAGKYVIYIDETNFNLFLRRNEGRSRRGTRCSVKAPTSKGKNVHVIGAVSQTGLVYWERRRGSYKKPDCQEWLRSVLRRVDEPLTNVVIVCDNAPVHSELELVSLEEEFEGVTVLRLAPYSAPLNPIEECWSVLKSHAKQRLSATMTEMLNATPPVGMTQVEYRLQFLENIIDSQIGKITPIVCSRSINHVQRHYSPCIQMIDLKMGDMVAVH